MVSPVILEYISGLTDIVFDEAVLKRIAYDRGVERCTFPSELSQKQKDLLLADLLWTAYLGGTNIPSFARQHGQFSTSKGAQQITDKEALRREALRLYGKWGEEKEDTSCLTWME